MKALPATGEINPLWDGFSLAFLATQSNYQKTDMLNFPRQFYYAGHFRPFLTN